MSAISCFCVLHMALSDYGVDGNKLRLERAICNHGLFMMSPNHWDTLTNTFTRPLRLTNSVSVTVSVSQPPTHQQLLLLKVHGVSLLSPEDQQIIKAQVARMLRLSIADENAVQEFHKLHPEARNQGFGRLFRSPSLFEDMVKSFLLCNCNWKKSLDMAERLCELQYEVERNGGRRHKRKRSAQAAAGLGNFPSAEELSLFSATELNKFCNLGYRARYVLQLAGDIVSGKLQLQKFEMNHNTMNTKRMKASLERISGVWKFTSANIMMCLGYYHFVPSDTETIRHLKEFHGIQDCSKTNVASHATILYESYSPFHCLAYWFELIKEYERQLGKPLSELKKSEYKFVTARKSE